MFKITIIIITLSLVISCSLSLERNNPLDPLNSGIQAPGKVTGINISVTEENTIEIQWDIMNPIYIDGYFIYRSQTYNGLYSLIFEPDNADSLYEDTNVIIPGNFYWYKMSAYKIIEDKKLEGYRSEPRSWN